MSARDEVLKKIKEAADRRKEMRTESKVDKTVETFVFSFFKEAESILSINVSSSNKASMMILALQVLINKIKTIDSGCNNVNIVWHNDEAITTIQGIKIVWSKSYQDIHQVDPELYVDVSEMLFR